MIISSTNQDFATVYDGFDTQNTGLGAIDPNIFHSKRYQAKKTDKVLIGAVQRIRYTGSEHDLEPLILAIAYEPKYNTLLAYNLHYLPVKAREAILKLHFQGNLTRIKGKKPMIVNYPAIKRAIPDSAKVVRRYKVVGMKVIDQYKLSEWDEIVKENSKWSNWYRTQGKKKESFGFLDKMFKRFLGRR